MYCMVCLLGYIYDINKATLKACLRAIVQISIFTQLVKEKSLLFLFVCLLLVFFFGVIFCKKVGKK